MDAVMTAPLRMNELATEIADELDEHAPLFRVVSHTLASGARVIDAGVETDGGYDAGVSRRHAIISLQGQGWVIEDLGSSNGTFVNNRRLLPNSLTSIQSGDELKFGTLLLRVEL